MRSLPILQILPGRTLSLRMTATLLGLWVAHGAVNLAPIAEASGTTESGVMSAEDHPFLQLSPPVPIEFRLDPDNQGPEATDRNPRAGAAPISLAAADFDGDGMPDLLVGHASPDGAYLTLHLGNIDHLFPEAAVARDRRLRGESVDLPFLPEARIVPVPVEPDFLGAGDFDADGHNDILFASRARTKLYWVRGDSRGGFSDAHSIDLDGLPNALLVADLNRKDGLPDVAVALSSAKSSEIWVLEGPDGALRSAPERFPLAEPARELTAGHLDRDWHVDLAVALRGALIVIHGRDRMLSATPGSREAAGSAKVLEYPFPAGVQSIMAGDFVADPHQELAVLLEDANLQILESSEDGLLQPSRAAADFSGLVGNRLSKGWFSSRGHEQLLTWTEGRSGAGLLFPDQKTSFRTTALATDSSPLQVLAMRLNPDALSDLVFLSSDGLAVSVAESGACTAGKA